MRRIARPPVCSAIITSGSWRLRWPKLSVVTLVLAPSTLPRRLGSIPDAWTVLSVTRRVLASAASSDQRSPVLNSSISARASVGNLIAGALVASSGLFLVLDYFDDTIKIQEDIEKFINEIKKLDFASFRFPTKFPQRWR